WVGADYAITAQNNFSPIPKSAADAAAETPGVEAVGDVRTGDTEIFGKRTFATAVNPGTSGISNMDWKQGSKEVLRTLGANGAFVDDDYVDGHDLDVGSRV